MYKKVNEILGTKYKSDQEIDWNTIVQSYKLSPEFIEEFKDYLSWNSISFYQPLTEDFMRKHLDLVRWDYISYSQVLSPEFIEEFIDKLDIDDLLLYQPFINLDSSKVKAKKNSAKLELTYIGSSKLYQETKDRGWFIGTVYYYSRNGGYIFGYPEQEKMIAEDEPYLKARIWWKDLIMLDMTKKYEPIRLYKIV